MNAFRFAPCVCLHVSLANYRRFFLAALVVIGLLTGPVLTYAQKPLLKTRLETKKDEDQPEKKAQWMMRGREVAPGESAAALRVKAYQQKMVLRARRAQAMGRGAVAPLAPATSWVALGPAPLASDATGNGSQDYNWVSGRATTVVIDPSDATGNTVLLGGAYGGVWKSTNAGSKSATPNLVTWQSLIDDQPTLAVGAIALKPGNSNVILVGTGEANSSGDSYYGVGILRSTDGGATWTQISSAASGQSFMGIGFKWIVFSTSNPNLVVASTAGDLGFDFGLEQDGVSTARGLYYSTDAGVTWNRVTLSDSAIAASATGVVYDPSQGATGTFYAAIRRHGIYSSTDGQHFTRLATQPTAGLASANCPAGSNSTTCSIYRAEFAARPGRSEVYVWVVDVTNAGEVDDGIWQTTDGGSTWSQVPDNGITNCGQGTQTGTGDGTSCGVSQGAYNLELAAVPNVADTDLYAGTINIFKCHVTSGTGSCATIDAGIPNDWINLTHVYGCSILGELAHVHPDQHGLAFMVVGGKSPGYFAHDGGISRTLDGFTGLKSGTCTTSNQFDSLAQTLGSMTEFLSFSVHPTSRDIVLGGTQDNGSPKTGTATSSTTWQNALSGDGGFNIINPNAQVAASGGDGIAGDEWFVSIPFSVIGGCEAGTACDDTNTFLEAQPGFPNQGNIDQGPFYTNFMLDPQDSNEMIIGTCRIWRGDSFSSIFTQLSFNFDTQTTALCNGGEINQVAGLDAGGPKDASGFSKVIYATTWGYGPFANLGTGGEVWVTTDASVASPVFTNVTGTINSKKFAISSVAMDHSDATGKTAYVGIMGFHTAHVFQTTNAGTSWTDWTGTLPDAPVDALLVDPEYGNVYVSTDVGVFVSPISGGPSWTEVGPAAAPGAAGFLPNVPVTAIRIFNAGGGGTKKLRVSTYGRGVWEYDISPAFNIPAPLTDPAAANPGQSTHTSMMISPPGGNNFVGKITYKCLAASLPAGATCSFNPPSLPPNSPATSVTVTVNTAGPFTGTLSPQRRIVTLQKQNRRLWMPLGLPLAGVLFLGLAGRRLPRRIQVLTLCLTLGLGAFLIACGGGGGSGPPPPVTVQVATSPNALWPNLTGAPSQTANLTATVNNSTNQNVTWAITANGTDDTVTSTGTNTATYTAPSAVPPGVVVITATAQADSTAKGTANITIKTPTPAGTTPITVQVFEGSLEKDTTFNLNIN